jgi:hypothetical protein
MNKMGLITYSIFVLFIAVASNAGADSTSASARGPAPVRYTGPIIDVHLHTDPPASVIGVPNPVTHARDLRRFFVAIQAVSLGSMVAVSVQFRRTSAGGW